MEGVSRLKAPKNIKLSKPRPRIKDLNQNDIQANQLRPEDLYIPRSTNHTILEEENHDIRGDSYERVRYCSGSSNASDVSSPNTEYGKEKSITNYQIDFLNNRNSNYKDQDSESSSVCSNSDYVNANKVRSSDITSKMRAPRKVKLTKPRPLKSTRSDENGNDSHVVDGNVQEKGDVKDEDVTVKITRLIDQLKAGTLSVNDCLQLRDLLAVHCPHLEKINKDYIDNCFKHIEDITREKTVDKLVLISLRDLTALRQRAWQPYSKPSSTRKKSITWNDIAEEIPYKDCMLYDTQLQIVHKQLSMDSGLGEDEQILWDSEESFKEDLTAEVWSEFSKTQGEKQVKERSPSPLSVVEAVKGLKIVGENEEFVKVAAELLNKYLKTDLAPDEENNNKKVMSAGVKEEIKNNVIRQPLGPGSKNELMAEVEKTLPGGMHSAKGRRAMFRNYNSAMSVTNEDEQDTTVQPKPYSRDEVLHLSLSPLSRKCPLELSYLSKVFPDVCFTEIERYFHKDDLQIHDYIRDCPVRGIRPDNYSHNNRDGMDNYQQKSLRRGFSCHTGDSDTDSNSSRNGFDFQNHRPPPLNRVFSFPMGEQGEGQRHSFLRQNSDSGDNVCSRSGFGNLSLQHSTSFGSKNFSNASNVDETRTCSGDNKGFGSGTRRLSGDGKGFGSPMDKLLEEKVGFGSPSKRPDFGGFQSPSGKQNSRRNSFGSPDDNKGFPRRPSLPSEKSEGDWDR